MTNKPLKPEDVPTIKSLLSILASRSNSESFEVFVNKFDPIYLPLNEKNQLIEKKKLVFEFIDLLPSETKKYYPGEKAWMHSNLVLSANDLLQKTLFKYIIEQNTKFQTEFAKELTASVNNYAHNQIKQAYDTDQVVQVQTILNNFDSYLKNNQDLNEAFIMNLNSDVINLNTKSQFNLKFSVISQFTQLLPSELKLSTSFSQHLANLSNKLYRLINELNLFASYHQTSLSSDGVLLYQGHFARLSTIQSIINNAVNLNSIHIHMTNAFLIDIDFKLSQQRYATHSPDLVIVSPKVKIIRPCTIDLSCDIQPGYPNGQAKAPNGNGFGASGQDGIPGLPGFNGGQFVIIAEDTVGSENLVFRSKGGNGGPGQNGNFLQ